MKVKEYFEKVIFIIKELGDRDIEVSFYGNLGIVLERIGEYNKVKEYYEKLFVIK